MATIFIDACSGAAYYTRHGAKGKVSLTARLRMLKLVVDIPESHLEPVKAVLFAAGAGIQGRYDCCCWQVRGQGQFRPLPGSRPFIGAPGTLEQVAEYRVEMLCPEERHGKMGSALANGA
jgi:hypothetical protein